MADIYPAPPHLTVSIYCERPELESFALMHDVASEFGCQPANVVEVAPVDQEFELVSDLGFAKELLKIDSRRYSQLIAGQNPGSRVLRAGLSSRKFGKVVVEYLQRLGPGRHPVAVSLDSDALGVPESLWSAKQRRAAYSMAGWSRALLEVASSRCDALYGAIGVEYSLPTPWQIRTKSPRLPSELFISRHLVSIDGVGESLRRTFSGGEVREWDNGTFFSGWAPFNSNHTTACQTRDVGAAAVGALRLALMASRVEPWPPQGSCDVG